MANQNYPIEFKAKVVMDLRESGDSLRKVGKRHSVSPRSVKRWDDEVDVEKAIQKLKNEISTTKTLTGEVGFKPHRNVDLTGGELQSGDDEEFCRLYVFGEYQFSAFHAYCEAYDQEPETSKECQHIMAVATEHLSRPDIAIRISQLNGMILTTSELADAQLSFLIMQNQDLKVKFNALKLYYEKSGELDKDTGEPSTPREEYEKYMADLKGEE